MTHGCKIFRTSREVKPLNTWQVTIGAKLSRVSKIVREES